jgi:CRP-like cAMP-binding protein
MVDGFAIARFKQQGVIFRDGDIADSFFIIRQGYVTINRLVKTLASVENDNLGPGDLFGIEAVMSSHFHFDNAVAKTDCMLVAIRRDQFKQLIESNTATAMKISAQLSQRIRFLNMQLASAPAEFQADLTFDDGNRLYKIADYYYNNQRYNEAYYALRRYLEDYPDGAYTAMAHMDIAKLKDKVTVPYVKYAEDDFIRKYPEGSMICMEGETSLECFIVQKGRVGITKIIDNKEIPLSTVSTGEMFGEMALLESKPRSANAIAIEDCELMTLNKDKFDQTIISQPQIVVRLTVLLSQRIWYMSRQLRARSIIDIPSRCCEMLVVILERQGVHLNNTPHTFDIAPDTLYGMCNITEAEGKKAISTLIGEDVIARADNKVIAKNKLELIRRAKLYWTMHPLK